MAIERRFDHSQVSKLLVKWSNYPSIYSHVD